MKGLIVEGEGLLNIGPAVGIEGGEIGETPEHLALMVESEARVSEKEDEHTHEEQKEDEHTHEEEHTH